jgi:putative transposase
MARPEEIMIEKHLTVQDLEKQIKTLEKDTRVLKALYFVRYRYEGKSVDEAARLVGVSKNNAYIWQEKWNESGYDGIMPRFAGGKPSKLSEEQKLDLRERLSSGSFTIEKVREMIQTNYGVEYTSKQVRIIMRRMGLNYAKPFQHDYRRPADAEEQLKKTPGTER